MDNIQSSQEEDEESDTGSCRSKHLKGNQMSRVDKEERNQIQGTLFISKISSDVTRRNVWRSKSVKIYMLFANQFCIIDTSLIFFPFFFLRRKATFILRISFTSMFPRALQHKITPGTTDFDLYEFKPVGMKSRCIQHNVS